MNNKLNKPGKKIALFSIRKGLSPQEQHKKELLLWGNYCANGGDPSATPSFFDFGVNDGLVWCPTLEEFRKAAMNKSRNPVECVKTY